MNIWSKFQRRTRKQGTSEADLKVALLAGVLSTDSRNVHHHLSPSPSQGTIDPQKELYGENRYAG